MGALRRIAEEHRGDNPPRGGLEMHEISIAASIQEILEREIAERCHGEIRGRVPSLTVRLGSLTGVEPEALSFAWEVTREKGSFPDAELEIETVPARAACDACGATFPLEGVNEQCTGCGSPSFHLVEGRELILTRIVWEEAD
jgi:hydrogenase nickel incorporation protein HypA/HybF